MANQKRIVLIFPPFSPPYRISRLAAETKHGNESVDKGFSPINDVGDFVPWRGSGPLRWMFKVYRDHSYSPNPCSWTQTFVCVIKNVKLKLNAFYLSMVINHHLDWPTCLIFSNIDSYSFFNCFHHWLFLFFLLNHRKLTSVEAQYLFFEGSERENKAIAVRMWSHKRERGCFHQEKFSGHSKIFIVIFFVSKRCKFLLNNLHFSKVKVKNINWDFSGSPVVSTSTSKAKGVGLISGWGTKISYALGVKKPKHKTEEILEQIQ